MAKKKIGIYSALESTPNNKVEDLYLIVDKESIVFSVKHTQKNEFVALEQFVNNVENTGWHQLVAYLQNNSKLIQNTYGNIYFVWNSARFILTKKQENEDTLLYQQELNLVHGPLNDEELYLTPYDENYTIIFSVPDALSTILSRSFPTGVWHHYAEYVLAAEANNHALIYLFENNYCIRLLNEGRTQLINYFPIEGNDQNSYTILNACALTNLNITETDLKVWGYNSLQHEFINEIGKSFKSIEIVNTTNIQPIYSTYFIF